MGRCQFQITCSLDQDFFILCRPPISNNNNNNELIVVLAVNGDSSLLSRATYFPFYSLLTLCVYTHTHTHIPRVTFLLVFVVALARGYIIINKYLFIRAQTGQYFIFFFSMISYHYYFLLSFNVLL